MFFSKTKKPDARLILDVDSHSIRALIFEVPAEGGRPNVVKKMAVKLRIASGGKRTAEKMRELIVISLKFLERIPGEILVSMGPSIAEYKMETWPVSQNISSGKYSLHELQKKFLEAASEHSASGKIAGAELAGVETNGYLSDPLLLAGGMPKSLAFRVCTVSFSKEVGFAFENAENILGGVPLRFVPSPLVLAASTAQAQKIEQAIVVEVNDAETLVMAVKQGTLAGFAVFPVGVANFARRVGERRGVEYQEAKEVIRQISYGIQYASEPQKIEEAMGAVCEVWKRKFREAMDSLYCYGPFSGEALFLGEGAYILPLRSYLGSAEWLEGISYAANPRLRILEAPAFFEGDAFGGILHGPEDAELAALMHYSLFHKSLLSYNS